MRTPTLSCANNIPLANVPTICMGSKKYGPVHTADNSMTNTESRWILHVQQSRLIGSLHSLCDKSVSAGAHLPQSNVNIQKKFQNHHLHRKTQGCHSCLACDIRFDSGPRNWYTDRIYLPSFRLHFQANYSLGNGAFVPHPSHFLFTNILLR